MCCLQDKQQGLSGETNKEMMEWVTLGLIQVAFNQTDNILQLSLLYKE